jgi:hypothetical protein
MTFEEWIKDNPPPSLERLAMHYGGVGLIPEGVLAAFEAERAEWQMRVRFRHLDPPTSDKSAPAPLPESIPGADIPANILEKIEANMKQRGIGRRAPFEEGGHVMGTILRARLVTGRQWRMAHLKTGSIYFLRDDIAKEIKIGHSTDPLRRFSTLQTGSANKLRYLGMIAASKEIEKDLHKNSAQWLGDNCHRRGEWYGDHNGFVSDWLLEMTQGQPWCRQIWEFVPCIYRWRGEQWRQENNGQFWTTFTLEAEEMK